MAVCAHDSVGQVRRWSNEPYWTHVLTVAEMVSERTDDEDVLAAACLHDVLEDVAPQNPEFSEEVILKEFGPRVLNFVKELTDEYTPDKYPNLNRKARKALELERTASSSEEAKLIKRADIAHNHISIMESGDSFIKVWLVEKAAMEERIGGW